VSKGPGDLRVRTGVTDPAGEVRGCYVQTPLRVIFLTLALSIDLWAYMRGEVVKGSDTNILENCHSKWTFFCKFKFDKT
jgi:hypothetical protein